MPVNLDELTELMAGATEGPWVIDGESPADSPPSIVISTQDVVIAEVYADADVDDETRATAALIVAMHEALPDLLALQAEADRMRGALEGLVSGTNAVLGLIQLVEGRDDLPADLKLALLGNHRVNEAQAALRVAERALGGCND